MQCAYTGLNQAVFTTQSARCSRKYYSNRKKIIKIRSSNCVLEVTSVECQQSMPLQGLVIVLLVVQLVCNQCFVFILLEKSEWDTRGTTLKCQFQFQVQVEL